MPNFGKESLEKLSQCHPDLQKLFNEVVKYYDCKVLYGYRSIEGQFELFKKGRELKNGVWIIKNRLEVVTNFDGKTKKGKHNNNPSLAIDIAPYPIPDWKDSDKFYHFSGFVQGIAEMMKLKIVWGGDWNSNRNLKDQSLFDLPHFEI